MPRIEEDAVSRFIFPVNRVRILVVVLAALALASSLAIRPRGVPPADAFWERLGIAGLETSNFESLKEMLGASDAVVVAKVASVDISRTVQGDAVDDVVTYAQVSLEVIRVISGDAPAVVPLEFLLGATPEQAAADVKTLRQSMPSGSALYFLHEKRGKGEQGIYRVVNSAGLWTATSRGSLDTPLREETPADGQFAAEITNVQSVEEMAELVASLSGG